MRWDELFADLEAEFAGLESSELAIEVADRTRRELARIRLVDRLRVTETAVVTVVVGAGDAERTVTGRLLDVGSDWLLVERGTVPEVLVPLDAVAYLSGLTRQAVEPGTEGKVRSRLGLGHVLRGIARDRTRVALTLRAGGVLVGTIDRVGADHLDLAEHGAEEARRQASVRAVRTVPFSAVALVQRVAEG